MKKRLPVASVCLALAGCGTGPISSTPEAGAASGGAQSQAVKAPSPQELKQFLPSRIPVGIARSMLITVDASKLRLPDGRKVTVAEEEKDRGQSRGQGQDQPQDQPQGQAEGQDQGQGRMPVRQDVGQGRVDVPEGQAVGQGRVDVPVGQGVARGRVDAPIQEVGRVGPGRGQDLVEVDPRTRGRGLIPTNMVSFYPFNYLGTTMYAPYYLDATLGAYTPYIYSPFAATYPYLSTPFVSAFGCYSPYTLGWNTLYGGLWW